MNGASNCPSVKDLQDADLGAIFRDLDESFIQREISDPEQRKVLRRIAACRTAAMGGALWQCQACHRWTEVYHSCRDRHCPNCQSLKRFQWVRDRLKELLPVPYFHVVFTLPHRLNPLIRANPEACIGLLFRSAAQTLQTFAADPRHLGGKPGILMVLHTWGRRLNYHVHVHCIITGGGLSKDQSRWVRPSNPKWLFPVKALSLVFRAKYLTGLDAIRSKGSLIYPDSVAPLAEDLAWSRFKRTLAKNPFVVYAKRPFGGARRVVKYLGCYTHRVAISNRRIQAYHSGRVTLTYKDYKNEGRIRRQVMTPQDLARSFLQHVLPKGFMRIRSYGILANTKKKQCLEICRSLLGETHIEDDLDDLIDDQQDQQHDQAQEHNLEVRKCPFCEQDTLVHVISLAPGERDQIRALLWDSS